MGSHAIRHQRRKWKRGALRTHGIVPSHMPSHFNSFSVFLAGMYVCCVCGSTRGRFGHYSVCHDGMMDCSGPRSIFGM